MLPVITDNTHLDTNQTEKKYFAFEHNQQKWTTLTFIYRFLNYNFFKIQMWGNVCAWERAREQSVCAWERAREQSVCAWERAREQRVCAWERARQQSVCVRESEREQCVCVREREKQRRERATFIRTIGVLYCRQKTLRSGSVRNYNRKQRRRAQFAPKEPTAFFNQSHPTAHGNQRS